METDLSVQGLLDFLDTEVSIETIGEEQDKTQKTMVCPSCTKEFIPQEGVDLENVCPYCGVSLDGEGKKIEVYGDKDLGVPTEEGCSHSKKQRDKGKGKKESKVKERLYLTRTEAEKELKDSGKEGRVTYVRRSPREGQPERVLYYVNYFSEPKIKEETELKEGTSGLARTVVDLYQDRDIELNFDDVYKYISQLSDREYKDLTTAVEKGDEEEIAQILSGVTRESKQDERLHERMGVDNIVRLGFGEDASEGYEERGKRDGTGPYKGSAQRGVSDVGVRKMSGAACPFEGTDEEVEMFKKERSEHPSFSDEQVWQIVRDHFRKGVVDSKLKEQRKCYKCGKPVFRDEELCWKCMEEEDRERERKYGDKYKKESKLKEAGKKRTKRASRGKCVFQSTSSKVTDGGDHYPINSVAQARNALARVAQHKSSPKWYTGSLSDLKKTVRNAVKRAYPSIEVSDSKLKEGFGVGDEIQIKDKEGNVIVVPKATVAKKEEVQDGVMAAEITGSDDEDKQRWYSEDKYQIIPLNRKKWESKFHQCMSCAKVFKSTKPICPECKEEKNIEVLGEDVATIADPKLRKMFTEDKIEEIDKSIKRISALIKQIEKEQKGTEKSSRGYELQKLYNKIDELEHEKSRLLRSSESKLEELTTWRDLGWITRSRKFYPELRGWKLITPDKKEYEILGADEKGVIIDDNGERKRLTYLRDMANQGYLLRDPIGRIVPLDRTVESKLKEAMKDWQCQECGYRFNKTVPKSGEMKCPKCGSYDIDVDTGAEESMQDENIFAAIRDSVQEETEVEEQEANGYKTIAKGIPDKEKAEKIARENDKAVVIEDEDDKRKFAVIIKDEK